MSAAAVRRGRRGARRRCRRASPRTSGSQQLLDRRAQDGRRGRRSTGASARSSRSARCSPTGVTVRLAGQDSRRGTFVAAARLASSTPRTGEDYLPLSTLAKDRARFFVHDSLLCEFAAMGFEYGYSVENPDALVLWEAQFGDFANGAQSIVDEFISSGEVKWGQRVVADAAAAARPRGPGPRPHVGPPGAVPAAVRRGQHAGGRSRPPRPTTSTCCAARRCRRRRSRWSCSRRSRCCGTSWWSRRSPTSPPARSSRCIPATSTELDPAGVKRVLLCSGKVYYDLSRRAPTAASPTPRSSGWSSSTRCRSTS